MSEVKMFSEPDLRLRSGKRANLNLSGCPSHYQSWIWRIRPLDCFENALVTKCTFYGGVRHSFLFFAIGYHEPGCRNQKFRSNQLSRKYGSGRETDDNEEFPKTYGAWASRHVSDVDERKQEMR